MVNIGKSSIYVAELWGLREGLLLCKSLGLQHLQVEMDSEVIVNLLQERSKEQDALATLLIDCRSLLQYFDNVSVIHVYREENKAADLLAEMGHQAEHGTTILQEPPTALNYILDGDKRGPAATRYIV